MEETSLLIQDKLLAKWSWYTGTFNEVYAATFVLLNIVRGNVEPELTQRCWTAIDALFPEESSKDVQSKYRASLHNLVAYAREKRHKNSSDKGLRHEGNIALGAQAAPSESTGYVVNTINVGYEGHMTSGGPEYDGSDVSIGATAQDGEGEGSSWVDQFVDEMVGSRFAPWSDLTEFLFQ
jgi:hypothetical protein